MRCSRRSGKEMKNSQNVHKCHVCGFEYMEKSLAEKCEAWCRVHKSGSTEITRHAVKKVLANYKNRITSTDSSIMFPKSATDVVIGIRKLLGSSPFLK